MTRYKRVLIKLSGGAVAGASEFGFEPERLDHIANEILSVVELGVEVALVIGGGKIFRGNLGEAWGIERAEADNIFAVGNGQPFVTTDYPSVQRAIETGCDALLVAKQGVDGVLHADPRKDKTARRFVSLHYNDVLARDLRVMDQAAFILARD